MKERQHNNSKLTLTGTICLRLFLSKWSSSVDTLPMMIRQRLKPASTCNTVSPFSVTCLPGMVNTLTLSPKPSLVSGPTSIKSQTWPSRSSSHVPPINLQPIFITLSNSQGNHSLTSSQDHYGSEAENQFGTH